MIVSSSKTSIRIPPDVDKLLAQYAKTYGLDNRSAVIAAIVRIAVPQLLQQSRIIEGDSVPQSRTKEDNVGRRGTEKEDSVGQRKTTEDNVGQSEDDPIAFIEDIDLGELE